jgi:hypothetical protein
MGWGEVCTGFWWGDLRKRYHWEDPAIGGNIMLWWIFRKCDVGVWIGLSGLRIKKGNCECGNEPSGSIKCGAFLD